MIIEATKSNTSGVWVKSKEQFSTLPATGGATHYDERVPAHELVVLVKCEELYNMVQNERDSSARSSKLERELT